MYLLNSMEPQHSLASSVVQFRELSIYKSYTPYTKADSFSVPFGGTVARVLTVLVPRCVVRGCVGAWCVGVLACSPLSLSR